LGADRPCREGKRHRKARQALASFQEQLPGHDAL